MNNNTINFSDYDTVLDIYTVIAEKYILFTDKDLIDLSMKDNKQYSAFGITIPNKIIKESINYLNADKSIFSNIVRKYPYIQLILLYWMYNKMYEVDKKKGGIIDGEIYNSIYDFQYETIKYTYFVYPFEIYDNIAKRLDYGKYYDLELVSKYIQQFERKTIKVRDFSNKYNIISYSADDINAVLLYDKLEYFSIYDLVYDSLYAIILSSFFGAAVNGSQKLLLPINQSDFKYEEYSYKALYKTLRSIYPKAKDTIIKLVCKYPILDKENSLIVKSKPSEFFNESTFTGSEFDNKIFNMGIGYDEAYEISARSVEYAQANSWGDVELYENYLIECAQSLCPPYKKDGYFSYKEYEEATGSFFYASHNFASYSPSFYLYRYLRGYIWRGQSYSYNEYRLINRIYAYLYRKYSGLQLMTLLFINAYCR
ncbi:conserved hypothetical protein [Mucispirillum schaedleri ASF457]|uniref:hypothetical protein n=2 Tax=Mucispirillum schaedleri TaxID=248039 RepID=UPI00096A2273|nr:hypothetical protein [Mucispirillum schaedleri]SIW07346.1 conserved hypothetical protein [Mucispirillum schaedleri ASF457]